MTISDVKPHSQEVLLIRVDRDGNILKIVYRRDKNPRLARRIMGKNLKDIGLQEKKYMECEKHLQKVFVHLQQEVMQVATCTKCYQVSYLPERNDNQQVESVLVIVRDITKDEKTIKEQ